MFDGNITSELNLTIVPCAGGGGSACELADKYEACALDATNCIGGCTGDAALTLTTFISCFEHRFNESSKQVCHPEDGPKCAAKAGITSDLNKCMNSPSRYQKVAQWIETKTKEAHLNFFPTVKIGGKMDGDKAQNSTQLKSELCAQGVKAAC